MGVMITLIVSKGKGLIFPSKGGSSQCGKLPPSSSCVVAMETNTLDESQLSGVLAMLTECLQSCGVKRMRPSITMPMTNSNYQLLLVLFCHSFLKILLLFCHDLNM